MNESEHERIVFGDPVMMRVGGQIRPYVGYYAASDPWESLPGVWQIAVGRRFGSVGVDLCLLSDVRKANVPDAVLELLTRGDS